ncbi:MAG: hypothetical protein WDM87_09240 [Terracidiphilus sp.]
MPLASILVQYLGRRIHERFERIQASFSDISAQAQENYSGVRLNSSLCDARSRRSDFSSGSTSSTSAALYVWCS